MLPSVLYISKPVVRPANWSTLPRAPLFSCNSSTPKMETAESSKTSVRSYQTRRRHIPEESNLHTPLSSIITISSHPLGLPSFFLFIKMLPKEFCMHFLFPNLITRPAHRRLPDFTNLTTVDDLYKSLKLGLGIDLTTVDRNFIHRQYGK
jgi:hypothetical protein